MMGKRGLRVIGILLISTLLISCAAKKPRPTLAAFEPFGLRTTLESGEYMQKVDNYMVILDASQSMDAESRYADHTNFSYAKEILRRMNQTIPDLDLNGALRTFGHGVCLPEEKTLLINKMEPHSKARLDKGLAAVTCDGGPSPLAPAIDAASDDVKDLPGRTAIIIVSDGKQMGRKDVASPPLAAAERMKSHFGDRLCIYTVLVGDDVGGKKLLDKIAKAGECGFSVNAEEIATPQGMADFVEKVFLGKAVDSDGDGVYDDQDECPGTPRGVQVDSRGCPLALDTDGDGVADYLDQCPNTPPGVPVDAQGCPFDSDGDGVYDYMDKCPGTPAGMIVDENGCELYKGVLFDFDKSNVKPVYYPMLDQVIDLVEENPNLRVTIQGHTDNIGSEAYNMKLSEKRARAVKDYLINKGLPAERISIEGYGFSKPIASNDTPDGRARNRRAEVRMIE